MFTLTGVTKTYGRLPVLVGVDLATTPGKTTVLIGPSGCGKSTLLSMMTGLIRPDTGTITFEGEPITAERLPEIRQRIGYVIQDGGLFPHLTGLANITLMARHLGRTNAEMRRRVDELITLTRLQPDLLERFPAEMSGGQRQRVSIMRALMLDADVLLLDEPLAALDPMVRAELQNDLADIFRRLEKTVVLVTHDMNEAAYFGDEIVLMRAGRILQRGSIDDLLERPSEPFVSAFTNAQRGRLQTAGRA